MSRQSAESDVLRRTDAWATAERSADVSALDDILADDFVGIGPRGFMLTKEQWLARYRSGDLQNESFDLHDLRVRVYGTAAILTGRQTGKGKFRGQEIQGHFRATLVFVDQSGLWRLASVHLSPIADGA